MRNQARALVLVVLSLVTAVVLGIASVFVSALALGATALIVPGTGTPDSDVVAGYRENAWNRYIDGIVCTDPGECADPDLVGIPYPASFWPLSFLPGWCVPGRCEKWDVSVGEGTENLLAALSPFLAAESAEEVFVFGYSQGGAVVANALTQLTDLSEDVKSRLNVVTIGGIENPDGGMWQRLAWLRYLLGEPVPILDLSFDPAMPTDTGIPTTTIGFEYDPVVYAPLYWGNPFAIVNMIAAFDTVHGYYLAPNQNNDNPMPYGYTDATLAPQLDCGLSPANCRTDSFGNSYIMIPATSLPLTDLVRSLADSLGIGWLAEPFIDLAEPVLREFVDLGFDWSGDPGISRALSILPFKIFQNWLKVGVDLAVAAVKGVEAFIKNFIPEETASLDRSRPAESAGEETTAPETDVEAGDTAAAVATDDTTDGEGTATVEEDGVAPEDVAGDEEQAVAEDVSGADAAEDATEEATDVVTEETTDVVTEDEVTVDDEDADSETTDETDTDTGAAEVDDTSVDTPAAA
ncbi:PE-PPE domain-containing protein [Mycolicibacterium austroafricanum]|uniref:PE-PPE domain-containing protein n=2 Tax=Mycolicibacterium TaxID=1866885 RepID=A0ABT8H6B3_MYCAO|nr:MULTISPECIES: PE-PPE domain-containing protein [Mycolicibacterium]MDN4516308.1 PE-PPE domain-containing protein [Mycolicibacterium austroafricanum]MDW5613738.1 PE-PPE domain-containing protein [Mycolicibacterium sp. D5.8-2]PQP49358.1 PE-PPE domain-containing protein [Mycolicibacterium austroafricanum]QRZ07893.1 PE-PPE domain-containing protein [Mycolicibacterium austroafricanum]QZT69557.1 PE-PPE domain-containing protein [Mycolicibacterium austroafricanum]